MGAVCVSASCREVYCLFPPLRCCFGNAATAENNWSSSVWNWGVESQRGRCMHIRNCVCVFVCLGRLVRCSNVVYVKANQRQLPGVVNRLDWRATNKRTPSVGGTCSVLAVSDRHPRWGGVIRRRRCGPLSERFCRSDSIISPVTFLRLDVHLQKACKLQMGAMFPLLVRRNKSKITWGKASGSN